MMLAALALLMTGLQQEPEPPLPDRESFLREVRTHLRSDRLLLSQYTYTVTQTERHLDARGGIRKSETTVTEVYPSVDEELSYRRVIVRHGKPLSPEDLAEKDRKHDRKIEKAAKKRAREGKDERERRLAKQAEELRKEEEAIAEVFLLYDITLVGRSHDNDRPLIELRFGPRREYRPRTREAKVMSKVGGRAWFSENDHQLVRLEAELLDDFGLGFGILARLNKGAKMTFERRLVNGEIWLPSSASFTGTGRLLLFKGLRLDVTSDFSDHRKFSVETSVSYKGANGP